MTAPTSPGVVPADDTEREAFERAYCAASPYRITPAHIFNMREGDRYITSRISAAWHGWQLARANRPSLTEDEREQVRREALEFCRDNWLTLSDTGESYEPNDVLWKDKGDIARRALADRSEPRQEKEDGRG